MGGWEGGFLCELEEGLAFWLCHEVVDHGCEVVFEGWDWGCCFCEVYAVDCCGLGWAAEEVWWELEGGHVVVFQNVDNVEGNRESLGLM